MNAATRAVSAAMVLFASPAFAEDVTTCGQVVSSGVLVADLDCSAHPSSAVTVSDRGTLDLAGHTITVGADYGIACERRCTIDGNGGAIVGTGVRGIHSFHKRSEIQASNLTITVSRPAPLISYGITGATISIDDCTIDGSGIGVHATRSIEATGTQVQNASDGLSSMRKISVENSTLSNNVRGAVAERKLDATGVTVTGNDYAGLVGRKVRAATSTVTGNGSVVDCPAAQYGCADVLARKAGLEVVACDTSARVDRDLLPTGETLGICSND